mgnify:CR=1 FL=1
MTERMKTSQALLFLTLSVTMFLSAQDQPDMTILFNYFDSTVTIYVDNDEIVIEGDGVPSHLSPYFVQTYGQTQNGFYYWLDSDGDGINDLWMQTPANMNLNSNRIAQQGYEFRIPLYPAINPNAVNAANKDIGLNSTAVYGANALKIDQDLERKNVSVEQNSESIQDDSLNEISLDNLGLSIINILRCRRTNLCRFLGRPQP